MRCAAFAPIALFAGVVLGADPDAAASEAARCRLALVLALDVSSSVDAGEDRLQRVGLASALQSPEVASAFLSAPGAVALYVFEWSGSHHQSTMLDWTLIDTPEDLAYAAGMIGGSVRQRADLADRPSAPRSAMPPPRCRAPRTACSARSTCRATA